MELFEILSKHEQVNKYGCLRDLISINTNSIGTNKMNIMLLIPSCVQSTGD